MMRKRNHILCVVFLTVVFLATACNETPANSVVVPNTDTTPPTVGIDVHFPDGSYIAATETTGPPPKQIKGRAGNKYVLTVLTQGKDPEGMKSIEIWLSTTKTSCDASGLCSKSGPGLVGAPITKNEDLGVQPGATAQQNRTVAYQPDIAQEINSVDVLTYEIWAVAINAHGMKTTSKTIHIDWSK